MKCKQSGRQRTVSEPALASISAHEGESSGVPSCRDEQGDLGEPLEAGNGAIVANAH